MSTLMANQIFKCISPLCSVTSSNFFHPYKRPEQLKRLFFTLPLINLLVYFVHLCETSMNPQRLFPFQIFLFSRCWNEFCTTSLFHHKGGIRIFVIFFLPILVWNTVNIMSLHVEQSHRDTLSGFNQSESQCERQGGRDRESNDYFFPWNGSWPGQRTAKTLGGEECQRELHLCYQSHWTQTDG